ncbi:MAG: hypothetical protein WKG32_23590, partial [Gemmatimonadaceae bacterium]
DLFTQGIAKYPDDARFLRHRGHRYLTVRSFERATVDLERAVRLIGGRPDQVEPDGLPNARNTPTSTLHSNSWYHLGLARYLRGDFERALLAWRACLSVSKNADMQVATTHWLYMTLRRLGRTADADAALVPIRRDMDVIENGSYLRLLLMYKGELAPDSLLAAPTGTDRAAEDPAIGYGVGNWHLYSGRREEALRVFRRVLAGGDNWPAFGYIAAEADVRRLEAGR